jgi:YHS domain-containing protein
MHDGVWGNVNEWGLEDHSDNSIVSSIDPVCRRQVDEAKAAAKTGYAGAVFYFCSKECQRSFEQARLAADLQPYLLAGQTIPCCIADLSGGGGYDLGVNIYVGAWVFKVT